MGAGAILKRLIWKEAHESLLVACAGILTPGLFLLSIKTKLKLPEWALVVLVLAAVLGTFLWAAGRANSKRSRNDFEDAYLVMPRWVDWLTSYLLPALVSFAIGAWLGFVLSLIPHWSESHWAHSRSWTVLSSGLFMMSGFCVCHAASSALGFLAGAIVAAVWLVFPGVPLISSASQQAVMDEGPVFVALMARAAIGAALGSVVLSAASRARPVPRLRAMPIVLAVIAALFGPGLHAIEGLAGKTESAYLNYVAFPKSSPDGSLVVSRSGPEPRMSVSIRLASLRTGISWARPFRQAVQPIGFTDRVAYLAQQGMGEDRVRVFAWDAADGSVSCVAEMRVRKNAILRCRSGAASPDGRLLIFSLAAPIGQGCDIWVLDTANGEHRVLVPNASAECPPVQWTKGRALLALGGTVVDIRPGDLGRREVEIPVPSEVQR